ncbi:hypothetical protein KI688_003356 [Linnemannia hyalina]|uniref:FAD-binding domain-containing protein n=1 Tax=Linnemannia hyalina TaxID=64524 RepID=A0A9P7XQ42_9FUNG|nr:hypothetical protein KI688_003356 [Linnemannia hyalina]
MTTEVKPEVLIVGAGIGGLLLGALLERANVPFTIFERTSSVKPLGSALMIGSNLLPLFEQLGIDEEFISIGKPTMDCSIARQKGDGSVFQTNVSFQPHLGFTGYKSYIVSRPMFYDLLLKQIPPHKIHFSKRVLSIVENDEKVTIQTADNGLYEGDIVVGADGAYSAVRQRMYETLKQEGKLPKSDQEELPFHCTCLVGQTTVVDLDDFPEVKNDMSPFYNTMGEDSPYTWVLFATRQSTLTWMVLHHLDKVSSKAAEEQRFRESDNSEWGPLAAQAMCDETRHFPLPIGNKKRTMGDIYDWTPKTQISKVMLEEKVFQTWHSGRRVLLGDACHKLDPSGAHGAVTSMHDAIALANLIYALPANTNKAIEKSFAEYQKERIPHVMESFKNSQDLALFMDRGFAGALAMFVMQRMPQWLWALALKKMIVNRPTAGFLKPIAPKGTVPAARSPSTEKARAVYNQRLAAKAAAATKNETSTV